MHLYSTTEVALLTGIAESRIHYAHRCGKLAGPTYLIAGKRIYTAADLMAGLKRAYEKVEPDFSNLD